MKKIVLQRLTLGLLLLPLGLIAAEPEEAPEEIVVVGRQPGPPLWRVRNGDNTLWIFPMLSPLPKDMIWESDRVAAVIAEAEEYLVPPNSTIDAPMLTLLNPINIFRGVRLAKRLARNPDDQTLQDVLPAELYARFAVLRDEYFADEAEDIERLRPLAAGGRMVQIIQEQEGLVDNGEIRETLQRLVRRNRDIERTESQVELKIEGNYRMLAGRAEDMMESLDPEQELACFEGQIARMESDLDAMKSRANAWAQGYIDEFRDIPLQEISSDPCIGMVLASTERDMLLDMALRMNAIWLANAERALAGNRSTFAVLNINELLSEGGLLSQLKAKGYDVREP